MDESRKARENAAERKRSRSEEDTGRKTGPSFGLCLFFGRENRSRFSRRAGPSMRCGFGRWLGPGFCDSQSRAGRSLPPRRPATDVAVGPAGFNPLKQLHFRKLGCVPVGGELLRLRANSAIRRIAVLGEGDVLAARGGAPRTNLAELEWLNRACFCGSTSRRACGGASLMPGPDAAARTRQN